MESPNNTKKQSKAAVVESLTMSREDEANVGINEDGITEEDFKKMNFAEKLFMLLHNTEFQTILHWLPSGDAFCVTDQYAFESKIISKYFPSAQFHSFARRMRRWGFHRVESKQQRSNGITMFKCVHFRRGRPDLCKLMCDDRQAKKLKKKNKTAAGAGIEGSPAYTSSLNLAITELRDIGAACKQNQSVFLPPRVMASTMPTVGLQRLNLSSSECRSNFGQYDPSPVDFTRTLPFQQALKQIPSKDPVFYYDRHALGFPAPASIFHSVDPTAKISVIQNRISPLAAFQYSVPPGFLPLASKGIATVELNSIQASIEAELAVVSRMRQLRQRSLTLAASSVAGGSESFLLSSRGFLPDTSNLCYIQNI